MKSEFTTDLHLKDHETKERVWITTAPLGFFSARFDIEITVPAGFYTDLSSVPRIPLVFWFWGGRAHREGVLHDYLVRKDSIPVVPLAVANIIFLDAMESRNKPFYVRYPMYAGVWLGAAPFYHKKLVGDKL